VEEKLKDRASGYTAIVSNQGGVGLGHLSESMALNLLFNLADVLFDPRHYRVYMCPHAPSAGCICRKPSPYALYKAMADTHSIPRDTLYVGDMESDREAAQRAGVAFLWAWEFFGWPDPNGGA
jgi:D-glycero-D-manno-heptose 1,7-bisphosphate phosphatase